MRSPIVVLAAILFSPTAASAASHREVDALLRSDVSAGFSGAVLVVRDGTVLINKGYGVEHDVKVRPTSPFWIASVGKQFVSAALLKCQERGWLTLEDPLGRFVPSAPADKRAITIRQLLAHRSGLDQTYASEGAVTRDDAVGKILERPLIDMPGNKFHYSNDNYQLAAAIIEIVSGESYREFVTQQLWRPLDMRDTGFNFTDGAKTVLSTASATPERLLNPTWGEAGVYSTTQDLGVWYRALRAGRILSPESVNTLFAPETPIQEGEAALGWFRGKTANGNATIFTRGNEDFGPNSLIYAYPDKKTLIIVLTHAGDANSEISWSRFVLTQLEGVLNL